MAFLGGAVAQQESVNLRFWGHLFESHWGNCVVPFTYPVNSENFARILFSRNFIYEKFCENKIPLKWQNHSVVY